MSTGAILGSLVVVVSVIFLLGNLVTAYRSQRGAIGQIPVMAFPVFIPAFVSFFLWIINRDAGWPGWPARSFAVIWIATTALALWAMACAGDLGTRRAASDYDGPEPQTSDDDGTE